MTLLIAFFLIYGFKLPSVWYAVATGVWLLHRLAQ
jgi:hypothetical protein